MQPTSVLAMLLASVAFTVAAPTGTTPSTGQTAFSCARANGLQGSPQCCQTNVLGVASLTCSPPSSSSLTQSQFVADCAKTGETASCCLLPVLGLGLICQDIQTGKYL